MEYWTPLFSNLSKPSIDGFLGSKFPNPPAITITFP